MAWIKVRHNLHCDPSVIAIATATGLDEDTIVGKLVRLWCWADSELKDGNARCVTHFWIDRYIGVQGFADAMAKAGWLMLSEDGVSIPKFERHMGKSAKLRAEGQLRAAKHRKSVTVSSRKRNAKVTQKVALDEMREDKMMNTPTPLTAADALQTQEREVVDAWNAMGDPFSKVQHLGNGTRRRYLKARLLDKWWCAHWREALTKLQTIPGMRGQNNRGTPVDFEFFVRSDSVSKIVEGKYDTWGTDSEPPRGRDEW